jgi:uncharacterized membrane protein
MDPTIENVGVPYQPSRFRRAVVRGLALALPPVLTIVILVWIANTIELYLLTPVEDITRQLVVRSIRDIREPPPGEGNEPVREFDGQSYTRLAGGDYIPTHVYDWLQENVRYEPIPARGELAYHRYVTERHMQRRVVVPVFLCVFILVLYLLGKLMAANVGDFFERGVKRLPLVRSVYAGVKKVTNFVFVDNRVHYKRVVAVEYPRKGIWSVGLVTSDGVNDINATAREPCVTVVLPGSPTPITGYCVMVPLRETHDLHLTIDQALQFYVSCGVVIPKSQHTNGGTITVSSTAAPAEVVTTAASPPLEQ